MGKSIGWVCIHRKIQECSIWESNEPFDMRSAWIDLILLANHEDKHIVFNGKPITVCAGQRLTSLRILAERWHWSRDRVRRYLDLLENEGMITRESDNTKTLLTLINYSIYQTTRDTDKTTDKTTNKTTNKTTDKTTDKTTHKTQTTMITMINNDNNDNNENKKKGTPRQTYGEYKHVKLTEDEFNRLCNDYGETDTLKAIKILDEYCQETGKTYKDYNLTLRRWPIQEAQKDNKPTVSSKIDNVFAEWEKKFGGKHE